MQQNDQERWFGRNWGYLVAIVLSIAVYLRAIGGEPIWDDVIVFERYLPSFRGFSDVFFPPADTGELGSFYYRPFVTASYMLDGWLQGWLQGWLPGSLEGAGSYHVFHLSVILFHALTVLGVGMLTRRLMPDGVGGRWAAFVAACTFAVHPIHVDSVAQITGRSDTMAGAFMVWSALAVLHGRERPTLRWPWYAAAAMLLAGLFSKEVAAMSIPLGVLLLLVPSRAPAAIWWRFGIAHGAAALVYLILRWSAPLQATALRDQSFGETLERLVRAIGYYVGMLAAPWPQAAFVPFESTPSLLVSLVTLLLLAAAGIAVWRWRSTPPVLRVAWCWFVATLVPALALLLVKASEQPVAERYLYVPSIALSLALGWLVARIATVPGRRKPMLVVVVILIALGALMTSIRARVYTDNATFWADTVKKAPDEALPRYQLGLTLRQAGKLEEAEKELTWALERYDDAEGRSLALNTLGTIHLERREFAFAERRFVAATEERPDYASPWFNLAGVYGMRAEEKRGPQNAPDLKDLERCVHALGKAVEVRPNYDKARVQLARQSLQLTKVYLVHGRRDDSNRMRDRARVAAEWLVQRGGPLAQQGQAVLGELGSLPR